MMKCFKAYPGLAGSVRRCALAASPAALWCATMLALSSGLVGCLTLPRVDAPPTRSLALNTPPLEVVTLADSLYAQGQYDKAQALLNQLTQDHPGNAYFWFRLGNCETQLARYPAAIRAYEQALQIDPQDGRLSYNLAMAHSAMARDAFGLARRQLAVGSPLRKDAEQYRRLLEVAVGKKAREGR